MLKLKQILLNYNLCIDNEWLQKYVDLIFNNIETKRVKYETQKHHFIPIYYYKWLNNDNLNKKRKELEKISSTDKNNFIVNLKYTDHILAHYYLALCAKKDLDLCANIKTISYIRCNKFKKLTCCTDVKSSLDDFINNLEFYNDLYTKAILKKTIFNKGIKKKCVSRDGVNKRIPLDEVEEYLQNGWKLGWKYSDYYIKRHKKPHSEDIRKRMSESHKGKSSGMLGKHFSQETIEKLKIAHGGKNNGMYGKHHKTESCEKISKHMQEKYNINEDIKNKIINLYKNEGKSFYYIHTKLKIGVRSILRVLYNEGLISEEDLKNKYKK